MSSIPENVAALHREVQRKFGRNLLRLQQYEKLMKSLIAEQDVSGPASELHNVKARQVESVSKKTLGQVVGHLTENCLASALATSDSELSDDAPCDLTEPWVRMSFRIEMADDVFNQAQQKLAALVDLRNELVHHFLEKHDIWTEPGCLAADGYLDDCFKQIDAHYEELRAWAKQISDARAYMASWAQTPEFDDFLIHGIMPGGAGVFWSCSTIVNLLRDAEMALAKGGWTLLQSAIDYISNREPGHTPKKYGCSSWRHVLHESEQFEIRKEQSAPGLPTETWYRSRP